MAPTYCLNIYYSAAELRLLYSSARPSTANVTAVGERWWAESRYILTHLSLINKTKFHCLQRDFLSVIKLVARWPTDVFVIASP